MDYEKEYYILKEQHQKLVDVCKAVLAPTMSHWYADELKAEHSYRITMLQKVLDWLPLQTSKRGILDK